MTYPLDVVHLCTELSVGGAENHLRMLLSDMSKDKRYRPQIVAFRDAKGSMKSLRSDFERQGIPIHILGQNHGWDLRGVWRLAALLTRLKPTILHTHLFRGDVFGPPLGALMHVPVRLSTVHNVEDRFKKSYFQPIFKFSYFFDDCVIAISDAVGKALQHYLGLHAEKIKRIYYGFEPESRWANVPEIDFREKFGLSRSDFVIGTIGRICPQKGHSYLIEALNALKDSHPNIKLLLVGAANQAGTEELLRSMVRDYDLEKRVVFAGYQDDVRSVLSALDLFVLPSLWEGFGLVLLEAMSMKKPIIASRVDAIPEVVEDGVQGILVPPADASALKQAIESFAASPALLSKMGSAGPIRVQRFSAHRALEETVALYDALVRKRLGSRI